MSPVFVDTHYFLAILNPRDAAHAKAVRFSYSQGRPLVTTCWVLTELADALARPQNRPLFRRTLNDLRQDPEANIIAPSQGLFDRGIALYDARPDKEWSLTDCISFVVMSELGLTEALTADRHFEQAGFRALLA